MKKTLLALCATLVCAASFAQPMAGEKTTVDDSALPRARAECARTVGVDDFRDYHRCMTRMGFGQEIRAEHRDRMREDHRTERPEAHQGVGSMNDENHDVFDHEERAIRREQQRQESGRHLHGMNRPDRDRNATQPTVRRAGAAECKAMTGGSPGIPSFDACMNARTEPLVSSPANGAPVLWQHPGAQR